MRFPRCRVSQIVELGRVSRSGFYRFDYTGPEPDPDMDLRDAIQKIAVEWPRYGRPRITAELRHRGWKVNSKRVYRLMREDNLLCVRKRKFVVTRVRVPSRDPGRLSELSSASPYKARTNPSAAPAPRSRKHAPASRQTPGQCAQLQRPPAAPFRPPIFRPLESQKDVRTIRLFESADAFDHFEPFGQPSARVSGTPKRTTKQSDGFSGRTI
jgi:HTH-like domain